MIGAIEELRQLDRAEVDAAAERLLIGELSVLYGAGWQPAELIRQAGLKAKPPAARLCRWLITADHRGRSGERFHQQWTRQLEAEQLPVVDGRHGWIAAWADQEPAAEKLRIRTVIWLAWALRRLPTMEVLIPPPSGVRVTAPVVQRRGTEADPILHRVRSLLAKAESTLHEAEATAFTAKAHELMTKHTIDLALVEGAGPDPGRPGIIRLPIDAPYADSKALLLQVIAEHSRCRSANNTGLGLSQVIGYSSDLDTVELLFTSLLVQAQQAVQDAAAGAAPGSHRRSQGFRSAFLLGFADRIAARLAEINEQAYAAAGPDNLLPILRSRDARIDDFVRQHYGNLVSSPVRGGSDLNGLAHGRLAGDAAALSAGEVAG